jgi:hypothetical protein
LEWFSILPDGTRVLLNDSSNTNALMTFRARTAAQPVLKMSIGPVLGGSITISWTGTGTLQESTSVNGGWGTSASQLNPQTIPALPGSKFYRLKGP